MTIQRTLSIIKPDATNPLEIDQACLLMIESSLFNLLQLCLKNFSFRVVLLLALLLYQQVSH